MPAYFEYDPVSSEGEMGNLLYGLIRMLKPKIIVETGCYHGHTTARLGEAALLNHYGWVYSCDTDAECVAITVRRCNNLPVLVAHCSSLKLEAMPTADFIYSDSNYNLRVKEIELAKPGAVIVVHDTSLASRKYDPSAPWLGGEVVKLGGLIFEAGRGFGILIKKPT